MPIAAPVTRTFLPATDFTALPPSGTCLPSWQASRMQVGSGGRGLRRVPSAVGPGEPPRPGPAPVPGLGTAPRARLVQLTPGYVVRGHLGGRFRGAAGVAGGLSPPGRGPRGGAATGPRGRRALHPVVWSHAGGPPAPLPPQIIAPQARPRARGRGAPRPRRRNGAALGTVWGGTPSPKPSPSDPRRSPEEGREPQGCRTRIPGAT